MGRYWQSLGPAGPADLCDNARVGKKKKTRRDTAEIARSVVEQAIGEKLAGDPLEQPEKIETDPRQGRGGSKGGPARAEQLTARRRSEIAKRAAQARWNNHH